jgi:hypothetical protein
MRDQAIISEAELQQAHLDNLVRMAGDSEEARAMAAEIGAAKRKRIRETEQKVALQQTQQLFGAIESALRSSGKVGFAFAQRFAIARATVAAAQGVAEALKLGWPASILPAAVATAQGAAAIARIRAIPAPQAHAGLTSVPETGTYLLKDQERVLSPRQNTDLTDFLAAQSGAAAQSFSSSRSVDVGGISIEVHADNAADVDWESVMANEIVPGVERALQDGLIDFPKKNLVSA